MTAWDDWLSAVDEDGPSKEVMKTTQAFFAKHKIGKPAMLASLSKEDLERAEDWPDDLEAKAFLRGCHQMAQSALAIKSTAQSSGQPPIQSMASRMQLTETAQQLSISGNEISAAALLAGVSPGLVKPKDLLMAVDMGGLPYAVKAEQPLFVVLEAERRAALSAVPQRQPYSYIDSTTKEMLPPFLTQDMIGGRFLLAGEGGMVDGSSTGSIGALGQALRAATAAPRFFRSFEQWVAVYLRYMPAAVACKHMSLEAAIGYLALITQLAEESRVKLGQPFLAFIYDDMLRRSWASRCLSGEALDWQKEVSTKDKQILELAESRLTIVLDHAGLNSNFSRKDGYDVRACQQAAESSLAKQQAAADTAKKKAEQASRDLVRQQERAMEASAAGWRTKDYGSSDKGGGKGKRDRNWDDYGTPEKNHKQRKTERWVSGLREKWGRRH